MDQIIALPEGNRVSVIIPVFNDPDGLSRCLACLEKQSYPKELLEIIVVDNGSMPPVSIQTGGVLNATVVSCPSPGAYVARNKGVEFSTGNILAFTDADCCPDEDWVNNGVKKLLTCKAETIVGGAVELMLPKKRTGIGLYQYFMGFQQKENIEVKGFSATANLFCWQSTFLKTGPFDERLFSGGDREWSWRALSKNVKIAYEDTASVLTAPRENIGSAIRQARRVTAGRIFLKEYGLTHMGENHINPHRSGIAALVWIFSIRDISIIEKIKILIAAIIIKITVIFEKIRIRLGFSPERK